MSITRKQSQKEKVLIYLQAGNSITPIKAMHMFGAMRLADIIYRLKNEGDNIRTNLRRDPENKSYAQYTLMVEPVKAPIGFSYNVNEQGCVVNVVRD